MFAVCSPNQIVGQIYDLLILSTVGFHRGTIWLKVGNLEALATNLPTLCQKICHENALYRPQIWVIRHWTTPMGRGSDWAISSAKNLRPVSDIQYCKYFSNIILSWKPTCLLCYQNKQWFPDYLAGTSRLGGVCVITGRSAIRGHGVGHYRSSECGGEEEKVESHPFGVSQVSRRALLIIYGALLWALPRKMISKCRRSGPHTPDLSLLRALSGILEELDGELFLWADQEDIK